MNDPTARPARARTMEAIMTCTRVHTLVTGASSGIGRATALRLAAAGQHVYAGVRTEADGKELAHAAAGWELTPLILDVTDPDTITAACATVTEHVGRAGLDGLVNNAGMGVAAPAELLPLDTFRRLLEINVVGQLAVVPLGEDHVHRRVRLARHLPLTSS